MNIISLLPSTTEICYALGLGDDLKAVTHECDWPPDAREKPHITRSVLPTGRLSSAEIDRLVGERVRSGEAIYELDAGLLRQLEPDLILTQELCPVCAVSYDDVVEIASSLPSRPEVLSLEPASVDEILESIERVAAAAGCPVRGRQVTGELRARREAIGERLEGAEPVSVVCLEWLDPPMAGGHWVPEMVRAAGGRDLLGPEGGNSPYLTWKQVIEADPDAIVLMPCGYDLDWTLHEARILEQIPEFRGLRAVRENRVYAVDGSAYFNRPGPRVIDGIELLARLLHPSRCAGLGPCDGARRFRIEAPAQA
ncbi:MAG: cobalamin-binding protein [Chloroflexota bacterium]